MDRLKKSELQNYAPVSNYMLLEETYDGMN